MHWYVMQSLVKCLLKMFTICFCVWEPQGKLGVQWLLLLSCQWLTWICFPSITIWPLLLLSEAFVKLTGPSCFIWILPLRCFSFMWLFFVDLSVLLQLPVQHKTRNKWDGNLSFSLLFIYKFYWVSLPVYWIISG